MPIITHQWLRRLHLRPMLRNRYCRYVAFTAMVAALVTWSYVFHPLTRGSSGRELVSSESVAPQHSEDTAVALHDNAVNSHEDHVNDVLFVQRYAADDGRGEPQEPLQQLSQNNNRYNQVLSDQAEDSNQDASDKHTALHAPPDTLTLQDTLETERVLRKRSVQVKETCSKYGLGLYRHPGRPSTVRMRYPPSANYDVLYIDRPDTLTWCPVYKAASTSWLHILCRLAGVKESFLNSTKEQISTIARGVWPTLEYDEAVQAVPHTTKFMIVRHPLERLVSAYRDKLENLNIGREHGVQHFYEAYGKKIVQKYRKNKGRKPVYLVDDRVGLPAPRGVEPTFEEFVKYLIDTDLVHHSDDHWMPYYLYCTPCYINYDVIAKFETLERDQQYLLRKLKLDTKISPQWKHLTKGQKTSEIVKKYLNSLSKSDLKKLIQKFKIDFEMFGYSLNEYV